MYKLNIITRVIILIISTLFVWGIFLLIGAKGGFWSAFFGGFIFQVIDYVIYNMRNKWEQFNGELNDFVEFFKDLFKKKEDYYYTKKKEGLFSQLRKKWNNLPTK